jgi:hypothetical protein
MRLPSRVRRPRYADVASTLALLLAMGGTAYAASLPANSVGTAQLKSDAVTGSKIGENAVAASEIASGAVAGSEVRNESLTLADLAGVNQPGELDILVQVDDCTSIDIPVAGAKMGQAVLFGFTGGVAIPDALVSAPPEIVAKDKVRVRFCNVGFDNELEVDNVPFRVVTFG